MDKATAEKLVLDRWRALPPGQRANIRQALDFADGMAIGLSFDTLGNPRSIIRAWVAREFQKPGAGGPADGAAAARPRR